MISIVFVHPNLANYAKIYIIFILIVFLSFFSCSQGKQEASMVYVGCADKKYSPIIGLFSSQFGRYISFSFFVNSEIGFLMFETQKQFTHFSNRIDIEFTHKINERILLFHIKNIIEVKDGIVEPLSGSAKHYVPNMSWDGIYTMIIKYQEDEDRYILTIHQKNIHLQCVRSTFSVFHN